MKKITPSIIDSGELDNIVNYAYSNNNDIYTIYSNHLILSVNDSELSIGYTNKDLLISLLSGFFYPQMHKNPNYDDILLIYDNEEVEVREYLSNSRKEDKIIIICDEEDKYYLLNNYLLNCGYKETPYIRTNHKKLLFRR